MGGGKFFRDEPNAQTPPPALQRRRTDLNTSSVEEKEKENGASDKSAPYSSLLRRGTGTGTGTINTASGGGAGPTSPWSAGPASGGQPPMGAFSFAFGQPGTPGEKKTGTIGRSSRLAGLIPKSSSDDLPSSVKEASSIGNLGRVGESDAEGRDASQSRNRDFRPLSGDTDPFGEENNPSGSAALGGNDMSPPQQRGPGVGTPGMGTPTGQVSRNDFGFSGLDVHSMGLSDLQLQQRRDQIQQQLQHTPQSQQHGGIEGGIPMSPTDTNPYQSPEPERASSEELETDESGYQHGGQAGIGGIGQQGPGPYGNLHRANTAHGMGFDGPSDRSQTSSAGLRNFPNLGSLGGLGGLNGLGGWPSSIGNMTPGGGPQTAGAADRLNPFDGGFDSQFGGTPGLGSQGFGFGGPSSGTMGRTSRLAPLIPQGMGSHMNNGEGSKDGEASRDTMSPGVAGRNVYVFLHLDPVPSTTDKMTYRPQSLQDLFSPPGDEHRDYNSAFYQSSQAGSMQTPISQNASIGGGLGQQHPGAQQTSPPQSLHHQSSIPGLPGFSQAVRMPDRIKWVYKDPSGNVQGPFTGLEMHEWYRGGFFSADLLVKKEEDNEYEALGSMIRRIGNSREPFLVPQAGGAGAVQEPQPPAPGPGWPGPAPQQQAPAPGAAGAVQPPFAGSFPSFGTTLTADQQNALERRKQEEQYLMARQREHLVQQQVHAQKAVLQQLGGRPGIPGQLHHTASGHSLHSQPSYGSIGSQMPHSGQPMFDMPGYARQAATGAPNPGHDFTSGSSARSSEDISATLSRLALQQNGQLPFGGQGMPPQSQQDVMSFLQQQGAMPPTGEAGLHSELLQQMQAPDQPWGSNERLQQFRELRAQYDEEEGNTEHSAQPIGPPGGPQRYQPKGISSADLIARAQQDDFRSLQQGVASEAAYHANDSGMPPPEQEDEFEQFVPEQQYTASSPPITSPWAKIEQSGAMPQPFPPPQSSTPLPAPTAQKSRHNIADNLIADSRSATQSPSVSVDTPSAASVAPWAKEPADRAKGPSLAEIQEVEAKKAAKLAEVESKARRALLQQEISLQTAAAIPAAALPTSATWGSTASPGITPTSATASAWAKPAAKVAPTVNGKKTLAQIQKEEEAVARKQRATLAAQAVTGSTSTGSSSGSISAGKRYADLASKAAQPAPVPGSSAWTTVGAGGAKAKPALGAPPGMLRTASGTGAPLASNVAKRTVTQPSKSMVIPGQPNANEEFAKWAKNALKGLDPKIISKSSSMPKVGLTIC
jgi:PERQ amino acid-rich with GYF domain-containing protein